MDEENDNDNIVSLVPKVETKVDEEETSDILPADEVYDRCKEEGFERVIVIGVTEDGTLGMASNLGDTLEANYMLDVMKMNLIQRG